VATPTQTLLTETASISPEEHEETPRVYTLTEFFETVPPHTIVDVANIAVFGQSVISSLEEPVLYLYCQSDTCGGFRHFKASTSCSVHMMEGRNGFQVYVCKNCGKSVKTYALRATPVGKGKNWKMMKYGELPDFGPPTSSRVRKLIGSSWDLYQKGCQSENQGKGIGAFAYYRRVVDSQKNKIFDELIKVSERLGADKQLISELTAAKEEHQFKGSIDKIKHALPQALMINGHNPLTLLYTALSDGLHNHSERDCLILAAHIRTVLTAMIERMAEAVKDDKELDAAVAKLLEMGRAKKEARTEANNT